MIFFRIILISIITLFLTINSYAIVRNHKFDDSSYLNLANNFNVIVKIETDNSFGSAILLNDTTVLTSAHNIKFKRDIKVIINYIEYVPNNIIYHPNLDLAILKINSSNQNINIEYYKDRYLQQVFTIVGYGYSGTGLTGATVRDFKKRAGLVRCSDLKNGFAECEFKSEDDLDPGACAGGGDSGGGVFCGESLAGIITYVSGKGGDGIGDSTYGDKTGFIPINEVEDWINNNL